MSLILFDFQQLRTLLFENTISGTLPTKEPPGKAEKSFILLYYYFQVNNRTHNIPRE